MVIVKHMINVCGLFTFLLWTFFQVCK